MQYKLLTNILSEKTINSLCLTMKSEAILPNDDIYKQGDHGPDDKIFLYFI